MKAKVQMPRRLERLKGKQKCYTRYQECCIVVKLQILVEETLSVPGKTKWRMAMEE